MRPDDHPRIIAVVDEWWGGRQMAGMLPRLFFDHFADTSLVVEDAEGRLGGFLVGFLSQTQPDAAYCHFIGVRPDLRGTGIGEELYRRFFELARANGRAVVRAVTSPVNTGSIAFHRRLGFRLVGDEDGEVPVVRDYDGPGADRVVFERPIPLTAPPRGG